ncbi:RnfH family protein [uncultured Cardiobacterium sp.]|uniref:RnfH family protein n=1 Tax=uncultured Cardiobacterium sp. TaxID=417619 RepID=UPI002627DE4D|nr:RnfH family protein [uncultured Cardiobacterium sp.]
MGTIRVEVAYAEPDRQKIIPLIMNEGATLQQAVERSGMVRFFPHLDIGKADFGVFSLPRPRDYVLRDGDRVEIYRPLIADPKEMRRQRARKH